MEFSIGEFSTRTGLSAHTLRYYEKEGLLAPARNAQNLRRYSEADLAWADFLKRLKQTGMPIKEIREYAKLRAAGADTLVERRAMLLAHRKSLQAQIAELATSADKLDEKIDLYDRMIAEL